MRYSINFHGVGIRSWKIILEQELFKEIKEFKEHHSLSQEKLIFDIDILEKFGVQHWSLLGTTYQSNYFELNTSNKIEIKQKTKTLLKIKTIELKSNDLLFPIYNTSIVEEYLPDNTQIEILQIETGLFFKTIINVDQFDVNLLHFECENFQSVETIKNIYYNKVLLLEQKSDTVIRMHRVITY